MPQHRAVPRRPAAAELAAARLAEPALAEPAGLPSTSAALLSPTLTRLAPARSMPVSVCARLPARNASDPRSDSTRPSVPCSLASLRACRTWPSIWLSPITMESRPQATESRCWMARSS